MIAFIEGALTHTKGPRAGQPFRLAPWQKRDIVMPTFGCLRPDGRRQYRTVFCELPRKNGKSQIAAAVALVMLFLDDEPGAEVLLLASDVDQARVIFSECSKMAQASPAITEAFAPIYYRDSISYPATQSVLKVMSADEKGIHGRNPSALVIDEFHTLTTPKAREFYAAATTAQGTRANPLTWLITTAGSDTSSPCYELHQYAAEVRAGTRVDPSFLSVYYGAALEADWTDRQVWRAANPALSGREAFLRMEYLEDEFRQAAAMPARQNTFRQLFLNQWVGQARRWIDMAVWRQSAGHAIPATAVDGQALFGGLDLSSVADMSVLVWLTPCPHTPGAYDVTARCFLPEAALTRSARHAPLYQQFQAGGWLTVTPGDVIDYRFIEAAVVADARRGDLQALTVDARFQGIQVLTQLAEHGIAAIAMSQTHTAYAAPMRELERLLLAGLLHHGGHPVLTWMAEHLTVKIDGNGDAKPDKSSATDKIDGIVAAAMAIDGVIHHVPSEPEPTYEMFLLGRPRRP